MVLLSLLSVYLAVMIGGEPIRNYFLHSTQSEFQGQIFLECITVFSFAVVASSYAFSVRSSDQLSSQLLMLISTVAGGVFLKLYLDRHSGPFFAFLSSIFLWFSPCFTFATCMFDLFALRGAQMSLEFGAAVGAQMRTSIAAVYRCISILFFQILFYMIVTITIDCHWAKVTGVINHIRFLLSLPLRFKVNEALRDQPGYIEMTDADYRSSINSVGSNHSLRNVHGNFSSSSSPHLPRQYDDDGDDDDDDFEDDIQQYRDRKMGIGRKGTGTGTGPGTGTPLVHTAHRNYNSTNSSHDYNNDCRSSLPSSPTSTSHPTVSYLNSPSQSPSVRSGHQCGLGIRKVLQAHGKVYGEIGMFPGVRNMQIGLLRRLEESRKEMMVDGVQTKTRSKDNHDIENNVLKDKCTKVDNKEGKYPGRDTNTDVGIWIKRNIHNSADSESGNNDNGDNSNMEDKNGSNSRGRVIDASEDDQHIGSGSSTDDIVKARDLFVEYSFGSKRKIALNGLNFEIKKGERVALLGVLLN